MITKITMDDVASFKNAAVLETDKKINLIYGLNGTGKSTFSNYLYSKANPEKKFGCDFSKCSVEGGDGEEILVYNQEFINDVFYVHNEIDGIFTMAKGAGQAEEKIKAAKIEKTKIEKELEEKKEDKTEIETQKTGARVDSSESVWKIYKDYYRQGILTSCFDRLGNKDKLFQHILRTAKPKSKPDDTVVELDKEMTRLLENRNKHLDELRTIRHNVDDVERNELFTKIIIGNEDSSFATLINRLNNSDWVKNGLIYINEENQLCPFCQQKTITKDIVKEIKSFFDESFDEDIKSLTTLRDKYLNFKDSLPSSEIYENSIFVMDQIDEFASKYNSVKNAIYKNTVEINRKFTNPSVKVTLESTKTIITMFNDFIDEINIKIRNHNEAIENIEKSKSDIILRFWSLMRWEYDSILVNYLKKCAQLEDSIEKLDDEIEILENKIDSQNRIISDERKKTTDIGNSLDKINENLILIGINDFKLVRIDEARYQLFRNESDDCSFNSLSEGEKMIISFLYFIELYKGTKSSDEVQKPRIIVIDDPISSLSHIHIHNVGELIKRFFIRSTAGGYIQLFLLTHSLYFFHDLVGSIPRIKGTFRKKDIFKLTRIYKNKNGSSFCQIKERDIQNDYQAYWALLIDENSHSALYANCMRNILEYFFGFVENKGIGDIFSRIEALKGDKYQAFKCYMHRGSHSTPENQFVLGDLDHNQFLDAFRLVFEEAGYKEHFEEMGGKKLPRRN